MKVQEFKILADENLHIILTKISICTTIYPNG